MESFWLVVGFGQDLSPEIFYLGFFYNVINNYKLRNLNSTTDYDYTGIGILKLNTHFKLTFCVMRSGKWRQKYPNISSWYSSLTDQHQPECQPSKHLKYFSLDQIWSKTMAILWYAALRAFLYNLTRDDICVLVSCYQNVHRLSHFNI